MNSYHVEPDLMGDALDRLNGLPPESAQGDVQTAGAPGPTDPGGFTRYKQYYDQYGNYVQEDTISGQISILKQAPGPGPAGPVRDHYRTYIDPKTGDTMQENTDTGQISILAKADSGPGSPGDTGYNPSTGLPWDVIHDTNSPSGLSWHGTPVNGDGSPYTGGGKAPNVQTGPDGNDYIWDGTKFVSAPGLPGQGSKAPQTTTAGGTTYIWDGTKFVPAPGIAPGGSAINSYSSGSGPSAGGGGYNQSGGYGGSQTSTQGPSPLDIWNQNNAQAARAADAAARAQQNTWQGTQNDIDRAAAAKAQADNLAMQEANNKQSLGMQAANLYDQRAGEFVNSISATDPAAFDAMLATGYGPGGDTADPANFNIANSLGKGLTSLSPRLLENQQNQLNGVRQLGAFAQANGAGGFMNPGAMAGLADPLAQQTTTLGMKAQGGQIKALGAGGDVQQQGDNQPSPITAMPTKPVWDWNGGGPRALHDQPIGDITPPVVTPTPAPAIPASFTNDAMFATGPNRDPRMAQMARNLNSMGYDANSANLLQFLQGKITNLTAPASMPLSQEDQQYAFLHGTLDRTPTTGAYTDHTTHSEYLAPGTEVPWSNTFNPSGKMPVHNTLGGGYGLATERGTYQPNPGQLYTPSGGYDAQANMGGFLSDENPTYNSMAGDTYYRQRIAGNTGANSKIGFGGDPRYQTMKQAGPGTGLQPTNESKGNAQAGYTTAGQPGAMQNASGHIDKKTGRMVPNALAGGGEVAGMAIVGDSLNGKPNPEVVMAPQGAQVIPLSKLGMGMDDVRNGSVKLGMHATGGNIADSYTTPPVATSDGLSPGERAARRQFAAAGLTGPVTNASTGAPPAVGVDGATNPDPNRPKPAPAPAPTPAPAPSPTPAPVPTPAPGAPGATPPAAGPVAWDPSWWDLSTDTQFDPVTGLPINDVSKIRQGVTYRNLNEFAANFGNILPSIRARWAAGIQAQKGVPVADTLAEQQRYQQQAIPMGGRTIGF